MSAPSHPTTDLVSRLRVHANRDNCISHDWGGEHHDAGEDCQQAADEIERLNANAVLLEREVSAAQDRIERDARHIERLGYMLEFSKQAQLTAEAETTKAMAAHAIEVAQLREEIARLRTAIDQVHNARLTWAMVCPCTCKPCDEFYEFVRDTLPDCSPDDVGARQHDSTCVFFYGKPCDCGASTRTSPP